MDIKIFPSSKSLATFQSSIMYNLLDNKSSWISIVLAWLLIHHLNTNLVQWHALDIFWFRVWLTTFFFVLRDKIVAPEGTAGMVELGFPGLIGAFWVITCILCFDEITWLHFLFVLRHGIYSFLTLRKSFKWGFCMKIMLAKHKLSEDSKNYMTFVKELFVL